VAAQKKNITTVRKSNLVKPTIVVAVRRQTLEEERRFTAALDLLLTEMVRQHSGRGGKTP
jgi:hypothetical protein